MRRLPDGSQIADDAGSQAAMDKQSRPSVDDFLSAGNGLGTAADGIVPGGMADFAKGLIGSVSPFLAGQAESEGERFEHPGSVPDEKRFKASELEAAHKANYFDADGNTIASSRTTPAEPMTDVPVGSWRIEDRYKENRGHDLSRLALLNPHKLEVSEHEIGSAWGQDRREDAERYAGWMKEGKQAPPIEVVETDSGKLKVSDGHRRHHAAKLAGQQVLAWVSPNADTGGRTPDGKPITTALTDQLAEKDWGELNTDVSPGVTGMANAAAGLIGDVLNLLPSIDPLAGMSDPSGMPNAEEVGRNSQSATSQRPSGYKQPTPKDLDGNAIDLWHGTSFSAWDKIQKSQRLKGGSRGNNASADVAHADQYPEETGAEVLVLIRANPADMSTDPNDQIGETVKDGLFPKGFGSSASIGSHSVLAAFDVSEATGKYREALQKGDFKKAQKLGVKVIHESFEHRPVAGGRETTGFADGGRVSFSSQAKRPAPSDVIPAMLTPGEVVLTKQQQRDVAEQAGTSPAEMFGAAKVPGFAEQQEQSPPQAKPKTRRERFTRALGAAAEVFGFAKGGKAGSETGGPSPFGQHGVVAANQKREDEKRLTAVKAAMSQASPSVSPPITRTPRGKSLWSMMTGGQSTTQPTTGEPSSSQPPTKAERLASMSVVHEQTTSKAPQSQSLPQAPQGKSYGERASKPTLSEIRSANLARGIESEGGIMLTEALPLVTSPATGQERQSSPQQSPTKSPATPQPPPAEPRTGLVDPNPGPPSLPSNFNIGGMKWSELSKEVKALIIAQQPELAKQLQAADGTSGGQPASPSRGSGSATAGQSTKPSAGQSDPELAAVVNGLMGQSPNATTIGDSPATGDGANDAYALAEPKFGFGVNQPSKSAAPPAASTTGTDETYGLAGEPKGRTYGFDLPALESAESVKQPAGSQPQAQGRHVGLGDAGDIVHAFGGMIGGRVGHVARGAVQIFMGAKPYGRRSFASRIGERLFGGGQSGGNGGGNSGGPPSGGDGDQPPTNSDGGGSFSGGGRGGLGGGIVAGGFADDGHGPIHVWVDGGQIKINDNAGGRGPRGGDGRGDGGSSSGPAAGSGFADRLNVGDRAAVTADAQPSRPTSRDPRYGYGDNETAPIPLSPRRTPPRLFAARIHDDQRSWLGQRSWIGRAARGMDRKLRGANAIRKRFARAGQGIGGKPNFGAATGQLARGVSGLAAGGTAATNLGRFATGGIVGGVTSFGSTGGATAGGTASVLAGGGVAGAVAAGFAGLAVAAVGVIVKLKDFALSINESNRGLARYNGSLSAAFASLDNARVMRTMQQASATSGTGTELTRAVDDFEKAVQPLKEMGGTALNTTGILILKQVTTMVTLMEFLAKLGGLDSILKILEGWDGKQGGDVVAQQGARDLGLDPGKTPKPVAAPVRRDNPAMDEAVRKARLGLIPGVGNALNLIDDWVRGKAQQADEQQKKRQAGLILPQPPMN